jgi:hypothetical protein
MPQPGQQEKDSKRERMKELALIRAAGGLADDR